MKLIFIVSIVTTTGFYFSCFNIHPKFERETEFWDYLDCENLKTKDSLQHVFIIQTSKCGACTDEVMYFLSTKFIANSDPKLFILSSKSERIINNLRNLKNFKIFINADNNLGRYGLDYADDIYFRIEDKKIEKWAFLDHTNVSKLLKARL